MDQETKVAIFKGKKVRRIIYKNEWWFSVVDVCDALTNSADAGAYWRKLKQRLLKEGSEVVTFCHGLKLEASDGKKYTTNKQRKGKTWQKLFRPKPFSVGKSVSRVHVFLLT